MVRKSEFVGWQLNQMLESLYSDLMSLSKIIRANTENEVNSLICGYEIVLGLCILEKFNKSFLKCLVKVASSSTTIANKWIKWFYRMCIY